MYDFDFKYDKILYKKGNKMTELDKFIKTVTIQADHEGPKVMVVPLGKSLQGRRW